MQPLDPDQLYLGDPNDKNNGRRAVISADKVTAAGLHDGSSKGGPIWNDKRAKDVTRGDMEALAGFGTTNIFDDWTTAQLTKLATCVGLHCGKPYTGQPKYLCCTCG